MDTINQSMTCSGSIGVIIVSPQVISPFSPASITPPPPPRLLFGILYNQKIVCHWHPAIHRIVNTLSTLLKFLGWLV
jgi:hypothetical protein